MLRVHTHIDVTTKTHTFASGQCTTEIRLTTQDQRLAVRITRMGKPTEDAFEYASKDEDTDLTFQAAPELFTLADSLAQAFRFLGLTA